MEANPKSDYITNNDIRDIKYNKRFTTKEWKTQLGAVVLDMFEFSENIEDLAYLMDGNTNESVVIDMTLHKQSLETMKRLTRELRNIKNWMDILSVGPVDHIPKETIKRRRRSSSSITK
jgi:hypothetical protein